MLIFGGALEPARVEPGVECAALVHNSAASELQKRRTAAVHAELGKCGGRNACVARCLWCAHAFAHVDVAHDASAARISGWTRCWFSHAARASSAHTHVPRTPHTRPGCGKLPMRTQRSIVAGCFEYRSATSRFVRKRRTPRALCAAM